MKMKSSPEALLEEFSRNNTIERIKNSYPLNLHMIIKKNALKMHRSIFQPLDTSVNKAL